MNAAKVVEQAMRAHILTHKMFDGDELRRQVAKNLKQELPGIEDELDQIGPLLFLLGFTGNPLGNTIHRLIRDFCRDAAQRLVDTKADDIPPHVRPVLLSIQGRVSQKAVNDNCLKGLRCPKCGSLGPFSIGTYSSAIVHDDGIAETSDHDWDKDSPCTCQACDKDGKVADFDIEPVDQRA